MTDNKNWDGYSEYKTVNIGAASMFMALIIFLLINLNALSPATAIMSKTNWLVRGRLNLIEFILHPDGQHIFD